jgi:hypothetical protein
MYFHNSTKRISVREAAQILDASISVHSYWANFYLGTFILSMKLNKFHLGA